MAWLRGAFADLVDDWKNMGPFTKFFVWQMIITFCFLMVGVFFFSQPNVWIVTSPLWLPETLWLIGAVIYFPFWSYHKKNGGMKNDSKR